MEINTNKSEGESERIAFLDAKKRYRRNILLNTISALLALAGIIWACNFFIRYFRYEITNDANIEQYITPINARVSGYVEEIRFTDHQWVDKGDTLVIIDKSELQIQLMEAEAALLEATATRVSSKATILRREAEKKMAEFNLAQSCIVAPYSGYLGRRTLSEGQLLQSGQTLTTLIKSEDKWVIANYREKQIGNLYIGQKVNISVDAISYKIFHGHVTAISEATGSKYSLLPIDNSAGNFVKVQQRIPVKIEFDDISEEDTKRLRVGMMVVVEAIKD